MSQTGVTIGSHSHSHVKLSDVKSDLAYEEMQISKMEIEHNLGLSADFFAYPYGLYNNSVKSTLKNIGYQLACSTRSGFNNEFIDPFELRRIDIFGDDSLRQFRQKVCFGINASSVWVPFKYYFDRLFSRLN